MAVSYATAAWRAGSSCRFFDEMVNTVPPRLTAEPSVSPRVNLTMPDTVATTVASSPDADKILPPQGITPENSPGVTVSDTMPAALASWGLMTISPACSFASSACASAASPWLSPEWHEASISAANAHDKNVL